jgi:cob(I)alamin adenosyltransferase
LRLGEEARVAAWILQYINRLSDLLYVIALRENMLQGKQEVIWRK